MADLPSITESQVATLIPNAADIQPIGRGGQKLVFRCTIDAVPYALKFAKVLELSEDMETEDFPMSDVAARAGREVETIRDCTSAHMVKLGPVGLSFANIDNESVLYFSEEFIAGRDLRTILREEGRLPPDEVTKLGLHLADAIKGLWQLHKIHRDVKPANIMRRDTDGDYVLLDAGFAFDVVGESLSIGPVGTPAYFSPEQFDFSNRRTLLDFRSDLFSLGVTLYQLATGTHPFWEQGDTSRSLFDKITALTPPPPSAQVPGFPQQLDDIILRMLGKVPHLRYRRCDQLIQALSEV
jgi:serine/threonine-protein kinase